MVTYTDDENNEENEESFAAMLEAYSPVVDAEVRVGDKISGKIVSIGKDSVFIDTGTKIDGVVAYERLGRDRKKVSVYTG